MPKPGLAITGLGRCGTSAVMAMLDAAGAPVVGIWPDYEPSDGVFDQKHYPGVAYKLLDPHMTEVRPPFALWLHRDPRQQAISASRFLGARELNTKQRRAYVDSLRGDTEVCLRLLRSSGHVEETSFERLLSRPSEVAALLRDLAIRAGLGAVFAVEPAISAVHRRGPKARRRPWEHSAVRRVGSQRDG